ncbi:hypothetical protein VTO73DRAFT_12989 [Trametes versicolor]
MHDEHLRDGDIMEEPLCGALQNEEDNIASHYMPAQDSDAQTRVYELVDSSSFADGRVSSPIQNESTHYNVTVSPPMYGIDGFVREIIVYNNKLTLDDIPCVRIPKEVVKESEENVQSIRDTLEAQQDAADISLMLLSSGTTIKNTSSTRRGKSHTVPVVFGQRQGPLLAKEPRVGTPEIPLARWHCRSCLADPCINPVATICGHIFCHSCIMREIVSGMACPACRKVFLVKLDV